VLIIYKFEVVHCNAMHFDMCIAGLKIRSLRAASHTLTVTRLVALMHWRAPYESVLLQHSFGIDAGTNDVDNAADAVADGDGSEDMQEDWCHIASAGRPTTTSAAAACASDAAAAAAAAVSSIDSGGRPMAAPAGTAAAGCSGQAATTDYAAAADAQTSSAPAARDIQPSHSKQGTSREGQATTGRPEEHTAAACVKVAGAVRA